MSEVVWQDPPDDGRSKRSDPRRVAMDANPGRWLLWHTTSSLGQADRLRKGGYEVATRRSGAYVEIYARRPEGWTP